MSSEAMRSVTQKKMVGYDIISHLPDPIIGHILGCLPFPDAVRTSILSSQWRYKYLEVSKIVYYGSVIGKATTRDARERLLLGILRILQAHDGNIVEFYLDVPELESCTEINKILKLVSEKGVQKILFGAPKGKSQILDSSFFSCAQLEHLKLNECVFQPPPSFIGFGKLVSLFLRKVTITNEVLSSLISQSPLLECLSLVIFNDHLEAAAPKLKFFRCRAHFKTLSLTASRLFYLSMTLSFPRIFMKPRRELTELQLKSIDSIGFLHLDYYYMKSLHRCGSKFKFEHLRVLRLSAICFGIAHEMKCMLELMKSCPNLEKIILEAFQAYRAEDEEDVTFSEMLDFSRSRIREVWMLDINGSMNELEFMKIMLLKLLQLETLVVAPDVKNATITRFNVVDALSEIQWISPQAVVVFRNSDGCKQLLHRQEVQYFTRYPQILVL